MSVHSNLYWFKERCWQGRRKRSTGAVNSKKMTRKFKTPMWENQNTPQVCWSSLRMPYSYWPADQESYHTNQARRCEGGGRKGTLGEGVTKPIWEHQSKTSNCPPKWTNTLTITPFECQYWVVMYLFLTTEYSCLSLWLEMTLFVDKLLCDKNI